MGGERHDGPQIAAILTGGIVSGDTAAERHRRRRAETVIHRFRERVRRRHIGIAVDGDRELRRIRAAMSVAHGVGEGIGQGLAVLEIRHRRIAGVRRVAVAAVGVQFEAAVSAGEGIADGSARSAAAFRTGADSGDRQRIAGIRVAIVLFDTIDHCNRQYAVATDAARIIIGDGRVVLRGDADGFHRVAGQAAAGSLCVTLVIVVEAEANRHRIWRIIVIERVGDGLGDGVYISF